MFYSVRPLYFNYNFAHVSKVNRVYSTISNELKQQNIHGQKAVILKNQHMKQALSSGYFSKEEYSSWVNSQCMLHKYKYISSS